MSTDLHHTEAHPILGTDLLAGSRESERDSKSHWATQLENQIRRFPRESILISFLLGGLLQIHAIRALLLNLVRLVFWLASPVLFGFAAWQLYRQSVKSES